MAAARARLASTISSTPANARSCREKPTCNFSPAIESASRLLVAAAGAAPAHRRNLLDDFLLAQACARRSIDAEFVEHLVGVRAQSWSARAHFGRRAREFCWWPGDWRDGAVSLRRILH